MRRAAACTALVTGLREKAPSGRRQPSDTVHSLTVDLPTPVSAPIAARDFSVPSTRARTAAFSSGGCDQAMACSFSAAAQAARPDTKKPPGAGARAARIDGGFGALAALSPCSGQTSRALYIPTVGASRCQAMILARLTGGGRTRRKRGGWDTSGHPEILTSVGGRSRIAEPTALISDPPPGDKDRGSRAGTAPCARYGARRTTLAITRDRP
jgi:hypothetical protein